MKPVSDSASASRYRRATGAPPGLPPARAASDEEPESLTTSSDPPVLVGGLLCMALVVGVWVFGWFVFEISSYPLGRLLASGLVLMSAAFVLRAVVSLGSLEKRVRFSVLVPEDFSVDIEDVRRFASALVRVRRAVLGFLDRPASAVRVSLTSTPDRLLRYSIEGPKRSTAVLRFMYHGADMRQEPSE